MEMAAVLYDVDCGFCRWAMARVLAWDRRRRLRPVAIQDAEGTALLARLDPDARLASWHLAFPDGRLYSAGPALAEVMRLLPGGRAPAAAMHALLPLTGWAYRLVAEHRALPGRLVSAAAKRRATEAIRARSAPGSVIFDDRVAAGRAAGTGAAATPCAS
jgi:predicted DCC family thiol-disulfide oxidoreductase YuxK